MDFDLVNRQRRPLLLIIAFMFAVWIEGKLTGNPPSESMYLEIGGGSLALYILDAISTRLGTPPHAFSTTYSTKSASHSARGVHLARSLQPAIRS